MDLYIAARQAQVCRPVLTAVCVVVLGTPTRTTALLPNGSTTTRTTGTTSTAASALFAPRSSPICRGSSSVSHASGAAAARSGLAGAFFLKEFVKRIFKRSAFFKIQMHGSSEFCRDSILQPKRNS